MEQSLAGSLHVNACGLVRERGDMRTGEIGPRSAGPQQCRALPWSICRWLGQSQSFRKSLSQWTWVMLVKTSLTMEDRRCMWLSENRDCHSWLGTLLLGTSWPLGRSRNCWTWLEGRSAAEGQETLWNWSILNLKTISFQKFSDIFVYLHDVPKYGPVFLGGSLFLHFALLFWNQTCTLASLSCSLHASSSRANTSGYGARSKALSSSSSWYAVNVVRVPQCTRNSFLIYWLTSTNA